MSEQAEPRILKAPWSDEQVLALLKWQTSPLVPSFTCGGTHEITISRDGAKEKILAEAAKRGVSTDWIEGVDWSSPLSGHGLLVPTNDGWRCGVEECMWTQDWCHSFMAEPDALTEITSRWPAPELDDEADDEAVADCS